MKNTFLTFSGIVILALLLLLPLFSFAQSDAPGSLNINAICDGSLANPCNFDSVFKLINVAIQWFLNIAIAVASITFMIAGGKMLMNPSNSAKRGEAVEMLKKTTIGIIIVLMAWLVIHTILATFTNINVTGIFFK
jgi:uncharacterized membrane protein